MMKRTLAAALLCAAVAASANPFRAALNTQSCTDDPTPSVRPVITAPVAMPLGVGAPSADWRCTAPVVGRPDTGLVVGWACKSADGSVKHRLLAVRNEAVSTDMILSAAAVIAAPDPREALRVHMERFVNMSFWDMCDVWAHPSTDWRARFIAATDPLFAEERWVVARNALSSTRPAYLVTSAGLLGAQNGRATVGAECACAARRIAVGASTVYCRVNGVIGGSSAEHVAVCTKTSTP